MSGTESTTHELGKLTVQQLKALCKENRISGYSKLSKAALIQKLTDSRIPVSSTSRTKDSATQAAPRSGDLLSTCNNPPPPRLSVYQSGLADHGNETTGSTASIVTDGSTTIAAHIQAGHPITVDPLHNDTSTCHSAQISESSLPLDTGVSTGSSLLSQNHTGAIRKKKGKLLQSGSGVHDKVTLQPGSSGIFKIPALPSKVFTEQSTSSRVPPASLIGTDSGEINKRPLSQVSSQDTNPAPLKKTKKACVKMVTLDKQASFAKDSTITLVAPIRALPKPSSVMNTPLSSAFQQAHVQPNRPIAREQQTQTQVKIAGTTPSRFKPLVLSQPKSAVATPLICSARAQPPSSLTYLDFQCSPAISLSPIARPPSMSQRKRIPLWATIFSQLPPRDLAVCAQTCRMFRYAVYLSAVNRLKQDFSGLRLALILEQNPKNMTDFWPYLRVRRRELRTRRQAYDMSFLPVYFQGKNPISHHIWTSPDYDKQIAVAIRFVITRLWFWLSVGQDQQDPQSWQVIDAQELSKDEIWSISCRTSSSITETFYVLEQTCEVIGQPPATSGPGLTPHHVLPSLPVRVDWSEYISQRLLPRSSYDSSPAPLFQHLKWTNHEEYDKGISKHWLNRIKSEGDVGVAKRIVAERYVFACVVGNSISGRWMTAQQMAQEFAGLPSPLPLVDRKSLTVNLYLPWHHHVESVHFTAGKGNTLHSALAVVQTPGREYYILQDNGMTVGCEEDGVGEVWQQLLGCNSLGISS